MTVWIVEDDAVILEGLTYSLTQEGYQVLTSGTVRDALSFWSGIRPLTSVCWT